MMPLFSRIFHNSFLFVSNEEGKLLGHMYSQLRLIRALWGIAKMLRFQKVRITEIRIVKVFLLEDFQGTGGFCSNQQKFELKEFELVWVDCTSDTISTLARRQRLLYFHCKEIVCFQLSRWYQ